MNPTAQALLDAQIAFIEQQIQQSTVISDEVLSFFDWLNHQKIIDIWTTEQINALLQTQILSTPATPKLIEQIQQHIALVLEHPQNDHTTIEDILPVETIDQIAKYISKKTEHRQKIIQKVVHHQAYTDLLTNIVQQSIQDYMDNSMAAKKIPGVGSFMKMGKSVLERATDTNLEDTLRHYLQKNIQTLSNLSEKLINTHFDDDKLYRLQAKIWHNIKKAPLSSLRDYILIEDLPQTVSMGEKIWDHIRQTPYLQEQVSFGVEAWVRRHEHETFEKVLRDINIDATLLADELFDIMMPIMNSLFESGYFIERIRRYLTLFYSSDTVNEILTT